jgi:hypothetical protein
MLDAMSRREVIHWLRHAMGLPSCGVGFWQNKRWHDQKTTTNQSEVTCRRCLAIIAKRKEKK